ncbi:MAG: hypothetical protein SWK76_16290 [Actinomycetota bacterium]|nr:hypothetical protein [Actinomycetota bacterium]
MPGQKLPEARVDTSIKAASGENIYKAIPGSVEYRRLDTGIRSVRNLGAGKMILSLDRENGELLGLQSFVKTARWRMEGVELHPNPDIEGALLIGYCFGDKDFAYLTVSPVFRFNEESRTLRIKLSEGRVLVVKAADCLLAGIDGKGSLTDIWMLDLAFRAE